MHSTLLHSDFCAAIIWFEGSGDEIVVTQSSCDVRTQAHHMCRKYSKIPKISPSMISPSKYTAPKLESQKNPLLNRPSTYKTPGGLYLEIALKYKVKQSKTAACKESRVR